VDRSQLRRRDETAGEAVGALGDDGTRNITCEGQTAAAAVLLNSSWIGHRWSACRRKLYVEFARTWASICQLEEMSTAPNTKHGTRPRIMTWCMTAMAAVSGHGHWVKQRYAVQRQLPIAVQPAGLASPLVALRLAPPHDRVAWAADHQRGEDASLIGAGSGAAYVFIDPDLV